MHPCSAQLASSIGNNLEQSFKISYIATEAVTLQVRSRHIFRSLIIFVVTFFTLQLAWEQCRDSVVETWVIDRATVLPAAWTISRVWPEQQIMAQKNSLIAAKNRLNILNGCEGLETLFLLIAAFLAYPLSWKIRGFGITLSVLLIYCLNQARIILLWWAIKENPAWFGLLHGTVLPLILIAIALIFLMAFLPQRRS